MQPDDVAVVHFSGRGALVDGALYLLPHEVDACDSAAIKACAIEISVLRTELHRPHYLCGRTLGVPLEAGVPAVRYTYARIR